MNPSAGRSLIVSPVEAHTAIQPTQMNGEIRSQVHRTKNFVVSTNQNNDRASLVQFGWEQIEGGPILPFIKRGSERHLPWSIVVEKVLKVIATVFSREMLRCISLPVTPLCKSEADTFNDINTNHYNKTLIGTDIFTPGHNVVNLDAAKALVKYFYACRNVIFGITVENDLFGFIRINGQNEIPFIWHDSRKFVPLFYFEGIDAPVVDIVCPWKIGYLQFCFKVQKIRSDLYKNIPFRVIDFKHVDALFPAESTFEVCRPENINHEILAPELQTVSTVTSVTRKRPAEALVQVQAKQARTDDECSVIELDLDQTTNQLENPQHSRVDGHFVKSHNDLSISHVNYEESIPRQFSVESDRVPPDLAAITLASQLAEPQDTDDVQIIDYQPGTNEVSFNQTVTLASNVQSNKDLAAIKRHPQLAATGADCPVPFSSVATHLPQTFYMNRPTERDYITNVPRWSPQVATSPGIRQTSPFMIAATETVQRQSQGNNFESQRSPSELVQQNYMTNNNDSLPQTSSHQSRFVKKSLVRNKSAVVRNGNVGSKRLPRDSAEPPIVPSQVGSFPQISNDPIINRTLNNTDLHIGSYQQTSSDAIPDHSLESSLQELADEEFRLNQTLWQTKQKMRMLKKQNILRMQPETSNAIPTDHVTTYQNIIPSIPRSVPAADHQQYASSNVPVVQNVNVQLQMILAENVPNCPREPSTAYATTTSKRYVKGNLQEKDLNLVVVDHILNIDTYMETYELRNFSLGRQHLLGIRLSLSSNEYLINFSRFSEIVLSNNCYVSQRRRRLSSNFNTLYKLNHVQKTMWNQAAKKNKLQAVGAFKGVFVELNETNLVLKGMGLNLKVQIAPF